MSFWVITKIIDILLNNNQELFITLLVAIKKNSNLFLRRGIEKNYKDNILETFSVIMGYSLDTIKTLLIKN